MYMPDWAKDVYKRQNGEDVNGGMSKKFYEYKKMVWANQLSYKFNIANDHHFDALFYFPPDK